MTIQILRRGSLLLPGIACLVLSGCFANDAADTPDAAVSDPFADMDCEEKIDAVAEAVQDSRPIRVPVPKTASQPSTDIRWIPPVGFGQPPALVPDLGDTLAPQTLPKSISAVQVFSDTSYRAHVRIYDYRDSLVREFTQDFGYQGELNTARRISGQGIVSYLVWDNRNQAGTLLPTGVYNWIVRMRFESGVTEDWTVKVGLIGPECRDP